MKKFFTDNMHLFVIIALALAGFAVYKIVKSNKNSVNSTTTATEAITE